MANMQGAGANNMQGADPMANKQGAGANNMQGADPMANMQGAGANYHGADANDNMNWNGNKYVNAGMQGADPMANMQGAGQHEDNSDVKIRWVKLGNPNTGTRRWVAEPVQGENSNTDLVVDYPDQSNHAGKKYKL